MTALQTMQTFLDGLNLSPKVKDAWKRVKERGRDQAPQRDLREAGNQLFSGGKGRYTSTERGEGYSSPQNQRREVIIAPT